MSDSEKPVKLRFLGGNNPVLDLVHVVTKLSGEVHVGEVGEFLAEEIDRLRGFARFEPVSDKEAADIEKVAAKEAEKVAQVVPAAKNEEVK